MNSSLVANFFLGREPLSGEIELTLRGKDGGEPVIYFDPDFSANKKNCLLYTSCHALPLRHYLSRQKAFTEAFNVHIILVHRLLLNGIHQIKNPLIEGISRSASVILSNPFVGQYEPMNLKYFSLLGGCQCLTYVPPNNAALWPVVEHFGERGVVELLQSGKTVDQINQKLSEGSFDSGFEIRWKAQMDRLRLKEKDCDISISGFCERNLRECKLWFTENHPTYNLIAWIGSQLCLRMGFTPETETACSSYPSDAFGDWNASPETQYEFKHYRFNYPMRFSAHYGGIVYYHGLVKSIHRRFMDNPQMVINDGLASY